MINQLFPWLGKQAIAHAKKLRRALHSTDWMDVKTLIEGPRATLSF
jgi:hypothetical protein